MASLLFFLSGISGLIYQVVWMRMLIRVFGISLYAISTVVAVFMGGLAIGSWLAGRYFEKRSATLRSYAWLEIGIGTSALLASFLMKYLPSFYTSLASSWYGDDNFALLGVRFTLAMICLILPTILMGATLPSLGQFLTQKNNNAGESLALLYGVNTLGAVIGVLFTGFVSLALLGEGGSIAVGVLLNYLIAGLAFYLSSSADAEPVAISHVPIVPDSNSGTSLPFYFTMAALTGFCALSLEVLWSRLSIFLIGSSVYSFSAILSIYLLGIGAGSLVTSRFVSRLARPDVALGIVQVLVAVTGLASFYVFWRIGLKFSDAAFLYSPLRSADDLFTFFGVSVLILFPSTFFMGISFPLFGRIVTGGRVFSKSIGTLYAWNTLGAVSGSLISGYLLVPFIGTQATFCLIVFLNFVLGTMIALHRKSFGAPLWGGLFAVGMLFILAVPSKTDAILDILRKRLVGYVGNFEIMFHREDPAGLVTGVNIPQGSILLINGIITSGNGTPGHVMAHLPLLMHPNPTSVAVICFGVGNTFRAAVDHVGRVDAVELMKGVVTSFGDFFLESDLYIKASKAKIYVEDGRQHLLMTKERYDLIVVDASPPIFSAGTVNLYTTDFLKICRKRLNPGGTMCLWVPTPCFEEDFWQIARGFSDVFPQLFVWAKPGMAGVMLMGSDSDLASQFLLVGERLKNRSLGESAAWLTQRFISEAVFIFDSDIRKRAAVYRPVTDDQPRTEFPLGNLLKNRRLWPSNDYISAPTGQSVSEM